MIYDYEDQEGWVSVWVGNFPDYETLDHYLSDFYEEDEADAEEPEGFFLPENANRPFEEELREMFEDGPLNQFAYDFGLSFDEDFREAEVFEKATGDMAVLLDPFSDSSGFIPAVVEQYGDGLPPCNAAVILYSFRYTGGVEEAKHDGIHLRFLGAFPADEG